VVSENLSVLVCVLGGGGGGGVLWVGGLDVAKEIGDLN
jgi:hypothetical protein